MKAEKLTINSQCTFHWNLEESLDAYAAAGFRNVEPHLNLVKDWLEDRGEPQARDQGVHRGDEGRTRESLSPRCGDGGPKGRGRLRGFTQRREVRPGRGGRRRSARALAANRG